MEDPMEPINRAIWAFNKGWAIHIVQPSSKVYRVVVPKPVRTSIRHFARNIAYPGRVLNSLLQGEWHQAEQESERFLCNSVVGLGGLFDVASRWKIKKYDNDFSKTFAHWGWQPRHFLVLPLLGPSSDRDAIGLLGDVAANPTTYFPPYAYVTQGTTYNKLSDSVDESVRLSRTVADPYSYAKYLGTFADESFPAFLAAKPPADDAFMETLHSVTFTFNNPDFANRGKTRSVLIPATGRKLPFTAWMQPKAAAVVYIIPGLGAHRLANTTVALSELAYQSGFSVVCISSAFHPEFMENASTAALPGYAPVDALDVHTALTEIDHRLNVLYPKRLNQRILLAYSMGAFHALVIAAHTAANETGLIEFNRFVAINPPVRLMFGVSQLDKFFQAPLAWAPEARTAAIKDTLSKMNSFIGSSHGLNADTPPLFDATESQFLIGVASRFSLRDVIFSSQQRHDQKVLSHTINKSRRSLLYEEILAYSYEDYFQKFAMPYYLTRGIDLRNPETLGQAADLSTYTPRLQANLEIRVVSNRNDVLLGAQDVKWLEDTFQGARLALFERGGHLGNLASSSVQRAILTAIEDQKTPSPDWVKPRFSGFAAAKH
jgi:ABC-type transporter lipoprotein component MlaA/pimeloyl-ACP methyl ester carboxylesterase